jgi:isopenicillin-N N-acyltransferase-like protein
MFEMRLSGTPFDRGYEHGRRYSQLIREHISERCSFEAKWQPEINRLFERLELNLEDQLPEDLEEAKGIAEGAGVSLRDILILTHWIEGKMGIFGSFWYACSLLGFTDHPDGAVIAKTSDHGLISCRFFAVQRVASNEGYDFVRVTFLGTTGTRVGLNETGLALTSASLIPRDTNWNGIPVMSLVSQILEHCSTVDEAIQMASRWSPIHYGLNIMVADASGAIAVIEKLPTVQAVRQPMESTIFCTNHCLAEETVPYMGGHSLFLENSYRRYDKLDRITKGVEHTAQGMEQILMDHSEPGAICQHGQAELHTTAAYIVIPRLRKMWIADGCPCEHEFVEHRLEAQE